MITLEQLDFLKFAFLACVVLVGIHGYLGIHVIAALGATYAFLLGHEPGSPTSYFLSLGFTLAGAAVFAATRTRHEKVPQEAIIGLVYAIASATAVLLADKAAHGGEHLKKLMTGNILFVQGPQLAKTAAIYAVVGVVHIVFRKQFFAVSFDLEKARAENMHIRLWDFLFYLSFGFVITSSVSIAGVLLVFCYLIAPAVASMLFFESTRGRLLAAWGIGTLVSAVALHYSYVADKPSGPTVIVFFGALLALAGVGKAIQASQNKPRTAAIFVAAGAAFAGVFWTLPRALTQKGNEEKELEEALARPTGATTEELVRLLDDERPTERSRAAKKLGELGHRAAIPKLIGLLRDRDPGVESEATRALVAMKATEAATELKRLAEAPSEDETIPLEAAEALAELGDSAGIERLIGIARDGEARQTRIAALRALKKNLPEAKAPAGDDEGLAEIEAWWTSHGRKR